MTMTAVSAPPQTQTFRYKATGRLWNCEVHDPGCPIRLTGNFFGPEDYVRVYVTPEELSADFEPVLP
jgi:hypothetical protein